MNNLIPFPMPSISFNGTIEFSPSENSIGGSIDRIKMFSVDKVAPELKIKSKSDYKQK